MEVTIGANIIPHFPTLQVIGTRFLGTKRSEELSIGLYHKAVILTEDLL